MNKENSKSLLNRNTNLDKKRSEKSDKLNPKEPSKSRKCIYSEKLTNNILRVTKRKSPSKNVIEGRLTTSNIISKIEVEKDKLSIEDSPTKIKLSESQKELGDLKASKAKRKYEEIKNENKNSLEDELNKCYDKYKSNLTSWSEEFDKLLNGHIQIDNSVFPQSLTLVGSQIFTLQKFWILLIQKKKADLSFEGLLSLFDESFNYISEESLIKPFYLQTMRESDMTILIGHLLSKGKINEINGVTTLITNRMLFSLLSSYAEFLLRSSDRNSSQRKAKKINTNSCNSKIEFTINSNKELITNVISIAESLEIQHKERKLEPEKKQENFNFNIFPLKESESENDDDESLSYFTPEKESNKLLPSSINQVESSMTQEFKDIVEPLKTLSQGTDFMIVSQNTVQKQMEFISNIKNASLPNITTLSEIKSSEKEVDIHNCSVHPNLTQDTLYQDLSQNFEIKIQSLNEKAASDSELKEESLDIIKELPNSNEEVCETSIAYFNKESSESRSRSRGRHYQSTEEYPDDLVEGSIRRFNKSFSRNEGSSIKNTFSCEENNSSFDKINLL